MKKKQESLLKIYQQVENNLPKNTILERGKDEVRWCKNEISMACKKIKDGIPDLQRKVEMCRSALSAGVAALPSDARTEAEEIIDCNSNGSYNSWNSFGKDTAITRSLFPAICSKEEGKWGKRWVEFTNSKEHLWTALEGKGRAVDNAEYNLAMARSYTSNSTGHVFYPDRVGFVSLNQKQEEMIAFANKLGETR